MLTLNDGPNLVIEALHIFSFLRNIFPHPMLQKIWPKLLPETHNPTRHQVINEGGVDEPTLHEYSYSLKEPQDPGYSDDQAPDRVVKADAGRVRVLIGRYLRKPLHPLIISVGLEKRGAAPVRSGSVRFDPVCYPLRQQPSTRTLVSASHFSGSSSGSKHRRSPLWRRLSHQLCTIWTVTQLDQPSKFTDYNYVELRIRL
jgi:hypothetical protein